MAATAATGGWVAPPPTPTEVVDRVAGDYAATLLAANGPEGYARDAAGRLLVPAGELDAEALAIPPDEFARALIDSRQGRRVLAAHDRAFFAAYYLEMVLPDFQVEWWDNIYQHRRYLQEAPRNHGKSTVLAFLDVLWRICMSATWIGERGEPVEGLRPDAVGPNVRILLVTVNAQQAKNRMRAIRKALEENQRLLDDFGPFKTRGGTWGEEALVCRRQRTPAAARLADPTFRVIGLKAGVTGGRCDHLIFDDIEDDESVNTEALRAKTRQRAANCVELLDDGTAAAIGTRKHADDWYARAERAGTWFLRIDRAFILWPGGTKERDETRWEAITHREPVDVDDPTRGYTTRIRGFARIDPGARVLWPTNPATTVQALLLKYEDNKATIGSWYFFREQQQLLHDDAASKFPLALFRRAQAKGRRLPLYRTHAYPESDLVLRRLPFAGRDGLGPGLRKFLTPPWEPDTRRDGLLIFQAWDCSLVDEAGKLLERDNDYTVGLTGGLNWSTKSVVLLDMFRARWINDTTLVDTIRGHAEAWEPIEVAIESNAFQKLVISMLRRTSDLPVHGHHTGKNKRDPIYGVTALSALLETRDGDPNSGRLVLPYDAAPANAAGREHVDRLVAELNGLGREAHDDCVMALWILWSTIQRYIDHREGLLRREASSQGRRKKRGSKKRRQRAN